jgi:hypothetical protein
MGVRPGTWEPLTSPSERVRLQGVRLNKTPGPRAPRPATHGSEETGAQAVPPSEGNEARREGRQGVAAPPYDRRGWGTDPGDPAEEREAPGNGAVEGQDTEDTEPPWRSQRNCNG